MKRKEIIKVTAVHPERDTSVWTRFHGSPPGSESGDMSLKTTHQPHGGARSYQSQQVSSSEEHEFHKIFKSGAKWSD